MSQNKQQKGQKSLKIDINFIRQPSKLKTSKALSFHSRHTFSNATTAATKNSEMEEFDKIIRQRQNFRNKIYSRSLINTYTPLTQMEKENEFKEMEEKSSRRFQRYSTIFDQIKKEISDINMNLKNKNSTEKIVLIDEKIEEKDEEENKNHSQKNQSICVETQTNNNKDEDFMSSMEECTEDLDTEEKFDMETLNEGKHQIVLSSTKENESMRNTKLRNRRHKLPGMRRTEISKKILIQRSRSEKCPSEKRNVLMSQKKINEDDFDTNSEYLSKDSCNCLIF